MGGKVAIALGLVAGVVVGGALVGAAVALAPGPPAPLASAPASVPPPAPATAAPPSPVASTAPGTPGPSPDRSPAPASSAPSSDPSPEATEALAIGQPAPPLRLAAVGGGTVDLEALRGKPVWLNLVATTCQPCRDELPLVQGFAGRYEDAGLVALLVDVGEDEAAVKGFLDELNVYLPTALDADGAVQAAWGATTLPTHVWIDKDGIVRETASGGQDPDAMAAGLQTILPDETVTP